MIAQTQTDSTRSTAVFTLDQCVSFPVNGSDAEYDELTADITNGSNCSSLEIVGDHLYRINPGVNAHSCTPGLNGTEALCVSADPDCSYQPGSEKSIRIDVRVTPGPDGVGYLSAITFFEQAPENFTWISGATGPNNYPTLYAVRVLKEGTEIYASSDHATQLAWNYNIFDFSGEPAFEVDEPTVFNIELLAYCQVGNGAAVMAWDVEEIKIISDCCSGVAGGELAGGPFTFCVGDGIADHVSGVTLSGNEGPLSQYIVTSEDGEILGLPPSPEAVDFDGAGPGICLIWHLSYEDGLMGLAMGNNAMTDLIGCFSLSNSITVTRNQPEGGLLEGGPFTFCVGDGMEDRVSELTLSGAVGPNTQYVVTDDAGNILGLPAAPENVDFDGAGPGVCLIWHLSYEDGLAGLAMGNHTSELVGCFSFSNAVTVNRNQPDGGVLEGGPFSFCVGDSMPDHVSGVMLTGNVGAFSQYVVTDTLGTILGLPGAPEDVDFDGAGTGICLIWHLSYEEGLTGLAVGNNTFGLQGCFGLSNAITVIRSQPVGGMLTGGPFEFCVGDGIDDHVSGIELTGNSGANSQYVVTTEDGLILGLPPAPDAVNFDAAGDGICLIWHLSYADGLQGLAVGSNVSGLEGCVSFSNSITVIRNQPDGGLLEGGPFAFCVTDTIPDFVSGISLSGNSGAFSQYIITDSSGVILGLPASPEEVDFGQAGIGVCFIWHLSYEEGLTGLETGNNALTDLAGCHDLSNAITVVRDEPAAGTLTGGPFEFCVGDGIPDHVSGVELSGSSGLHSQYIVTDTSGLILGLPPAPDSVDFDGAGPGVCLIWHLSYGEGLIGLEPGNNALTDLEGCFELSNAVTVHRIQPVGGVLAGGPFEFCVGDGFADMVSGVTLSGNSGSFSQYVITDTAGTILGLPATPESVNFDGSGPGICLIWHLSYEDTLGGLEMGANTADLTGCFSFSNAVSVQRNQPNGGMLTGGPFEFCVGDSIPDFVSGITLSGNTGSLSQWVVTNSTGMIVGLPPAPDSVDFNEAGAGSCLIWHLAYEEGLQGLEVGSSVADLNGCFGFSNAVEVVRLTGDDCPAPNIAGRPFDFTPYPSPVKSVLKLDVSKDTPVRVEIFDTYGTLQVHIPGFEAREGRGIDLSALAPGHYFVRLTSRVSQRTKSIFVVR